MEVQDPTFEIQTVWKQGTPSLRRELIELWTRGSAIADPVVAAARAQHAVCVARDADGVLRGVSTALARVPSRMRQPMYAFRHIVADDTRGRGQAVAFLHRSMHVLQAHDATLAVPEHQGLLLEFETPFLGLAPGQRIVAFASVSRRASMALRHPSIIAA